MKRNLRMAVCLMFCVLLAMVFGTTVQASTGMHVEYHSQDEIRQMSEVMGIQTGLKTGYSEVPVKEPPYNPGKLAESTVQNGLNTLNLIRYVAGIPYNVQNNEVYESKAQAAALVNWANGIMSHSPAKPKRMDDSLYHAGAQGAGSSNLGMGYGNLYDAITGGWMEDADSSNIDRVGHRRWCLNPEMEATGFGVAGNYYAMYAFDRAFSDKGYYGIAWPAQNMPVELFRSRWHGAAPWSISLGRILNQDEVHVTLTRKQDGRVWNFSSSGADGEFFVNNERFGQQGCIIFRPSGIEDYKDGDSFHVEIEETGTPISYDVDFFNMHKHTGGNATCTEKAVCSICGEAYGNLAAHQYKTVIERESTCTKKGLKRDKCTNCGKVDKNSYEYLPLKEHTWGNWNTERQGTYEKEGMEARSCSVCKKKETRTLPMIPKLKKVVSPRENSLTVTWTPVKGADGYRIYVKDGKSWKSIALVKGKVSSYIHKGLVGGTPYTYTVRAYKNREPRSTYSSYDKKGITGITILPVPQLRDLKVYQTGMKLFWSKVKGASGYYIYRKEGSGGWKRITEINSGTASSYADRTLKNGSTYTYTVRAFRKVNGRTILSSYDKKGLTAIKPRDVKDYKKSYPSTLASDIGGMKHREKDGKNEYYKDNLIIRYAWGQKVNHVINSSYKGLGAFGVYLGSDMNSLRTNLENQGFSIHNWEMYVQPGYRSFVSKGWDRIYITSHGEGKVSSFEWIGLEPPSLIYETL